MCVIVFIFDGKPDRPINVNFHTYFSSEDYEEVNSSLVTKIQFYAIELARNREGHNDKIRGKFKPKARGPKKQETEQFSSNLTQEVEQELQSILTGNHSLLKE